MLTGWSQVKIQDYSQQPFNVFLPQPPGGTLSSYVPTSYPSQTDIAFNRGVSSPLNATAAIFNQHHQKMLLIDQQKQATSFMPAGSKGNRFMISMNKKGKRTAQTAATGKKERKKNASISQVVDERLQPKAVVEGGRLRVELNGAAMLDERERTDLDEYLGVGDMIPLEAKLDERELLEQVQQPQVQPPTDSNNIRKLQDEQRDIEAKLKFIDGLINQQQNPQPKYFGGGILKKHTTEDFVVNLEQYQRAMEDIRKTMESLNGNKGHNNRNTQIFSIQEANSQSSHTLQTTTYKSLQQQDTTPQQSQNLTAKKYYAQYEDMIYQSQPQQQILNQRQVLSVIPTVGGGMDEVDKVSMSSHYTNDARLYDATLMRQSIDSAKLRHSIQSAQFGSGNKLDFNSNPPLDSPKKESHVVNTHKHKKSPQIITVIGKSTGGSSSQNFAANCVRSSEGGVLSERLLAGVHAPVIEDTREETTIEHDRDDSDMLMGEPMGNLAMNENQLALTKVDLIFEQDMEHKSIYESKMYRARTQVTNPSFKSKAAAKPISKTPIAGEQLVTSPKALEQLGKLPAPQTKGLMNKDSIKTPIKVPREILTVTNQLSKETNTTVDRVHSQRDFNCQHAQENSVLDNPLPLPTGDSPLLKTSPAQVFFGGQIPPLLSQNHKQIDDQRLTEMGKKALQLNRQSQSRLDVLDSNVIYQQDGDLSKGVLYFKNLDSLKSFILNKKRPIYSRKGNKVFQTEDAVTGLKLTRTESEHDDEKSRSIKADILKKRNYLHETLTNLMPQIQMRSMQQRAQQKANFQHTIDFVQKQVMGQTHTLLPNAKLSSGFSSGGAFSLVGGAKGTAQSTVMMSTGLGRPRELTWAPMTNIQQYPFEDMMNPDGIIDLRILGSITPGGVVIPGTSGSHIRAFSRQQQDSMFNGRSDSSPGMSRNGPRNLSQMSKRLQTFYGLNPSTFESAVPQNKSGFRGSKINQGSIKKMNHHESEQSIGSDSNDTSSSHQAGQRQVVFFKTSSNNLKQIENGGTFMMQYPTLRPRLNEDAQKLGGHTVAMQQQMQGHFSRTQAHGFATSQSAGGPGMGMRLQQETSLLRMSRGIERNKIRLGAPQIPGAKPSATELDGSALASGGTEGSPNDKMQGRKHVIFSSYEGRNQKHPQSSPALYSVEGGRQVYTTKHGEMNATQLPLEEVRAEKKLNLPPTRNAAGSRVPPIHPIKSNVANMTSLSSRRPDSKKSDSRGGAMVAGSFFGSHGDYNEAQQKNSLGKDDTMPPLRGSIRGASITTLNQNDSGKGKRVSNDPKSPPQITSNYEQTPNGKKPHKKNSVGMSSLKGLAQLTSPSGGPNQHGSSSQFNMDISHNMNQKSNKSYAKMDQTIAQNKFSVSK